MYGPSAGQTDEGQNAELWIVGQSRNNWPEWEFQGVFDGYEKAKAACRNKSYFIAPINLNEQCPEEASVFPGAHYPSPNNTGEQR